MRPNLHFAFKVGQKLYSSHQMTKKKKKKNPHVVIHWSSCAFIIISNYQIITKGSMRITRATEA